MNAERRRKKRIRNIICIAYCSLELLLVLFAFRGADRLLDFLLGKNVIEAVNGNIIFSNEEDVPEDQVLVICIDPGHGGKDNGTDYQKRYEKDDNLRLAQAIAAYLEQKNIKVIMTRDDDTHLKLSERCNIANESKADYFVSLHRNKGEGNGVEIWIGSNPSEETNALAANIMQGLSNVGIQRDRGVKKGTKDGESGDYYVNLHTDMPSCIVELGFINDVSDNQMFDEKLQSYAAAIAEAVLSTDLSYGKKSPTGSASGAESGTTETPSDNGTALGSGTVLDNPQIANVESLDNTSQDWGQGVNVDEKNRPVSAVSYQEKYGSYQALFLKEDTQTIYLTFDEGYEYGYTESILNTLKEKGVKAVFFVTEPYAKGEPDLVKRMIAEGHDVGNHSVTHPAAGLPSLSIEQQKNEILQNHQYIKDNFGYDMHLFRYPAGKFSEQSLAIVNNCGYKSAFWSFAYVDYDVNNQPEQSASLQKMIDKLHPGAIYLLHGESETNAAVLGDFIDRAREKGYEFAQLS